MNLVFICTVIACGFGLIINETAEKPPCKTLYHHMTAQFGVQNYETRYTRSAPLVVIQPEDGCLPIENKDELKGAIVLVKRGGACTYFNKSIVVDKYGGVGIVIGNYKMQDSLIWMASETNEVDHPEIPCVFVYKSTYDSALAVIQEERNGTVIATISLEGDVPPPSIWTLPSLVQITRYLLIFIPVVWGILTMKYFCRRNRARPRELRRRLRHIPEVLFTEDLLVKAGAKNEVAGRRQKKSKVRLTNSVCPICLENFENQTKIKLLPCDHGYHSECIGPWIADHSDSCPVCRQSVTNRLVDIEQSYCSQCCFLRASNDDEMKQPLIDPSAEVSDRNDEAPVAVNQEEEEQKGFFSESGQPNYTSVDNENHQPASIVINSPVEDYACGFEEVKIDDSIRHEGGRRIDL